MELDAQRFQKMGIDYYVFQFYFCFVFFFAVTCICMFVIFHFSCSDEVAVSSTPCFC